MKKGFFILSIALGLSAIAHLRTDGFALHRIQAPLPNASLAPLPPSAEQALSQPFHYLGKGRQCFVFESADGQYVLKFFNQSYLQMPWYSFLIKEKEQTKRARRRHFYEHSYEIAFRELGEEIVYLHLGPSDRPLPLLSLTDRGGGEFAVDLNALPFVLQRKGIPIYTVLQEVYEREGLDGLCREIDAFVAAVSLRIGKGIADGDHDVEHNWGYVEGRLFHLDPGRLYYDERLQDPARLQVEWEGATRNFRKWLQCHYPDARNRARL